jgi:hypothetical protein
VDHESTGRIERQIVPELLDRPFSGRVLGDVPVQDSPCSDIEYDEDVQALERSRYDHREVAREDRARMVVEERGPRLRRPTAAWPVIPRQLAPDPPRRHGEPELHPELRSNALCLSETPYMLCRSYAPGPVGSDSAVRLVSLLHSLRFLARSRASLHLEILALRHQLAVVSRTRRPHLRLTSTDRVLWTWLSRTWPGWRSALHIVKPETVVGWHRRGFRLFWTWKSRRCTGRPGVPADVRALIGELSTANPLWLPRRSTASCRSWALS